MQREYYLARNRIMKQGDQFAKCMVGKMEAGNIGMGQVIKDLIRLDEELGHYISSVMENWWRDLYGIVLLVCSGGVLGRLCGGTLEEL